MSDDGVPELARSPVEVAAAGNAARQVAKGAARNVAVSLAGQAVRVVIQVGSIAVLARLLAPTDYGLLAMVLVVVGIGEIIRDFGLSAAAVQAPSLSRVERDGLVWLNLTIGMTLSAALFASAPLIGALYGEPALVPLTRVLAATFVINGFATQFRAGLERDMRFGALAKVDVAAQGAGAATAVGCAFAGWGVWALAAQQIVSAVTMLVCAVGFAGWLPGRPRHLRETRKFVRFGWYLATSQLIGYAANNVDTLVVGLTLGKGPLGLYNRAFQLLMQSYNLVRAPVAKVSISALSRLHGQPHLYARFLLRGQAALGYTLALGLALVAGCAESVVAIMLGPQWSGAAPILACLAVAAAFETLAFVGYWVYISRALTRELLRFTMLSSLIKATCILVGSRFGLLGVASGYALSTALMWPVSIWWLSRCSTIPGRGLMVGGLRIAVIAAAVGGTAHLGHRYAGAPGFIALATGALAGGMALAALAVVIPTVRRDLRQVFSTIAAIRPERSVALKEA